MKVTKTTFNTMVKIRANKNKNTVMIQCMRKDGTWGKPQEYKKYGNETDNDVVKRLVKNNNKEFRIAQ